MAHRTQFSKDLILPKDIEQYRENLHKQIHKVRERQKSLIEESNQRLLLLEHRLLHGDQISHYNLEIARLNTQIANQQKAIRDSESQEISHQNIIREVVLETTGMRREAVELLTGSLSMKGSGMMSNRESLGQLEKISMRNSQQNQPKGLIFSIDPQEQLMSLTHEIIRLKKSLQEVRSKYSENFTEYKFKQELQKLRAENQQIALQLKQLETNKKIVNEAISASNFSDVNYDELEVIRARKEFEILEKERNLLREYWTRMQGEREEKVETDERRVRGFKEEKMGRLKGEIEQVVKHNQILLNEIKLTQMEIQRCRKYQLQLKGRVV